MMARNSADRCVARSGVPMALARPGDDSTEECSPRQWGIRRRSRLPANGLAGNSPANRGRKPAPERLRRSRPCRPWRTDQGYVAPGGPRGCDRGGGPGGEGGRGGGPLQKGAGGQSKRWLFRSGICIRGGDGRKAICGRRGPVTMHSFLLLLASGAHSWNSPPITLVAIFCPRRIIFSSVLRGRLFIESYQTVKVSKNSICATMRSRTSAGVSVSFCSAVAHSREEGQCGIDLTPLTPFDDDSDDLPRIVWARGRSHAGRRGYRVTCTMFPRHVALSIPC